MWDDEPDILFLRTHTLAFQLPLFLLLFSFLIRSVLVGLCCRHESALQVTLKRVREKVEDGYAQ